MHEVSSLSPFFSVCIVTLERGKLFWGGYSVSYAIKQSKATNQEARQESAAVSSVLDINKKSPCTLIES